MGHGSFLTVEERQVLIELARDGLAEHRLARRANALILVDQGMSYRQVAKVLLLDDDTIREWRLAFERDGIDGLAGFHYGGRHSFLSAEQEVMLKQWVSDTLPRTTREIGAYIEASFSIRYESRSGLVTLLHRLGFEHRKLKAVPSRMDPDKQRRFIALYEKLLNRLEADELVMFSDAVHPVYGAQPVGCWTPKNMAVAVEQTTGREHMNIQGAIDLETGTTCMREVEKVDAISTIALLEAIEARFPKKRVIYVIVDNARCHRANLVKAWLARPGCRVTLMFIPPYCPHLNPIERLWLLMHKNLIHNRCFDDFRTFCIKINHFLRREVQEQWNNFCDQVTDNFRIIEPARYRILK
jgi:transposase